MRAAERKTRGRGRKHEWMPISRGTRAPHSRGTEWAPSSQSRNAIASESSISFCAPGISCFLLQLRLLAPPSLRPAVEDDQDQLKSSPPTRPRHDTMAARLTMRQSQTMLRSLPPSPCPARVAALARSGGAGASALRSRQSTRCYASEQGPQKSGPSFQGQMLESISSRIARERKEREKFALERATSSGSRNWAITFSTSPPAVPAPPRSPVGVASGPRRWR